MKISSIIILVLIYTPPLLFGQSVSIEKDSTKSDSSLTDSTIFFQQDTLGLKLQYPVDKRIPSNLFTMPKPPRTPLDIDMRTSSYYTPREVQDKMDQIMNRPRSDTFLPVLAMAAFAVNVAAKQLNIQKLFELKADDYLISNAELQILTKLWQKAPLTIEALYSKSDIQSEQTAKVLQDRIASLSDRGLIKTRGEGKNNILFFPAQKLDKVKELFKKALSDSDKSEEEIAQLKTYYDKLLAIRIDESN